MEKELKDRAWKTLFLTQIHVDDSEIEAVRRYIELVLAERWRKHKLYLYEMNFTKRTIPDEEKRRRPPEGVSLHDWVKYLDIVDTDKAKVINSSVPTTHFSYLICAVELNLSNWYRNNEKLTKRTGI
ncbi:hypothetical protein LINPERHAP2_LOCUS16499 [Linum perenne]